MGRANGKRIQDAAQTRPPWDECTKHERRESVCIRSAFAPLSCNAQKYSECVSNTLACSLRSTCAHTPVPYPRRFRLFYAPPMG